MGAFRFLEHTADLRVECRAESLADLLETAALALYAVAFHRRRQGTNVERHIDLAADTREQLLVRWLQELIFLMDVERFAATVFDIGTANETALAATLRGYQYEPADRAEEVKAATYHELEVKKDAEGYVARLIFDL
ncbi:MAG TPA: archease [Candidatus Hydrogenedentes bacterium]|nr:archease [Candidatus Hydrogenedentota bacterium]